MKKIISYLCIACIILSCLSYSLVSADDTNTIEISSSTAKAGGEVEVVLSVSSSAAIAGLECEIMYESGAMELVSVTSAENGIFPSGTFMSSESLTANPYYVSWDNSLESAVDANGALAVMTFKIKSDAYNGEYAVTPIFTAGGAFDDILNDVDFSAVSGCITVTDGIEPENPITTSTATSAGATTTATTTTTKTTTTTTTTTTTVPANKNILYSWEENSDALTASNINASRTTEYAHDGEYSIKVYPKSGVWDQSGKFVTSSYFKNYVTIAIPSGLNITGNVGFYAYTTSSNTSNYEAYGVKMADGTYYLTKFAQHLSTSWKGFNVTGITLYKLDDSETTISLTSANFADSTEDSTRVAAIVFVDAGTADSSTPTYIDEVYYESDTAVQPSSSTSTTTTTTKPTVSGIMELNSSQVSFVNCKYWGGTSSAGEEYLAKMTSSAWNASDKFFGLKFDQSIFDLNPTKIEITLKTDGADYKGYYSWFSTSDYTSMQSQPAIESTIARVNIHTNSLHTISTSGTVITIDLTNNTYKDIVTNKFNYYYLCPKKANSSVTAMYCQSFKVYYTPAEDKLPGEVTMINGASIRLNEQNGIRFYTQVDREKIAALREDGYTVELGTLIAPADYLTESPLTFELAADRYADVPYKSSKYFTEDDFCGVVGSIVNLNDENIARDFVGRGYVKVTDSIGNTIITYADYDSSNIANNTRSLKGVAQALINDKSEKAQALYAAKKELVDKWAGK